MTLILKQLRELNTTWVNLPSIFSGSELFIPEVEAGTGQTDEILYVTQIHMQVGAA